MENQSSIRLTCINPEQKDLLDEMMKMWNQKVEEIRETSPNFEPSPYAFAYWLVRYSGLIK